MAVAPTHPLIEYQQAFMQFADCGTNDFLITQGDGAHVFYEEQTYRICHYDDLLNDFRMYFTGDLSEIYTEVPIGLWESLAYEHSEISDEDLIIDIYTSWKLYWESQEDEFESEVLYERAKERSWKEFEELVKKVQARPGKFVQNAVQISDVTLIPVVALALRSRFKNIEDFYRECVDLLIHDFPEDFGEDGNFDEADVRTASGKTETYYIFKPGYNYHDIIELYRKYNSRSN